MQKISTQAKHIVIFMLLLAVIPRGFVKGFFAYLNYIEDEELAGLLNMTREVYYKLCMDAAIVSFILTCLAVYFIRKAPQLKTWSKVLLVVLLYFVLFIALQFILIWILGNK